MAVQPFRGSRADWVRENGFEADVIEERGRYVLRRFLRERTRFQIAERTSLLAGLAWISTSIFRPGEWTVSYLDEVHFGPSPSECWEWWLAQAV